MNGTQGGDWQKSYTRNDSLGQTRSAAARLQLNWRLADRLDVNLVASGWTDGSDTTAAQLSGFRPQIPANAVRIPQVFAYPLTPPTARAADWAPTMRATTGSTNWP